jgi:tetratricopeptide (TPR) repeat protein
MWYHYSLRDILLNNPHLLDRSTLIDRFLIRLPLLEQLTETLRNSPKHQLLTGLRGMGKTTMLLRLASAITGDLELTKRYRPLEFAEEQDIARLSKFYENCIKSLAQSLKQEGSAAEAGELRKVIEDRERRADPDYLMQVLLTEADRLGQTLVLLVDNAERVLGELGNDGSRQFSRLLKHPRILFLGATSSPDAPVFSTAPFRGMLTRIPLEPIPYEDARDLFEGVANQLGDAAVLSWLRESQHRLQILLRLSGGNLRTLLTFYEIISEGRRGDIKHDIDKMLDQVTERYKSLFDAQGPLARRLLRCLSDAWPHVQTARDVADAADEDVNTVSSQLAKLIAAGLVVKGEERRGGRDTFVIAERFWSLWLYTRSDPEARTQVKSYAEMVQLFDDPREAARKMLSDMGTGRPISPKDADEARALAAAVSEPRLRWQLREKVRGKRASITDVLDALEEAWEDRRVDACISLCLDHLKAYTDDAAVWNFYGRCLFAKGDIDEARKAFEKAVGAVPELSAAWRNLGICHHRTGNFEGAAGFYLKATVTDDPEKAAEAWATLGDLYCAVLNRYPEAEAAYRRAIAYKPRTAVSDAYRGLRVLFTHGLRNFEDAELVFRRILEVDPHDSPACENLGAVFWDRKRYNEAEQMLRRAVEIDSGNSSGWLTLGLFLEDQERYEEAASAYEKSIQADRNNGAAHAARGHLMARRLKLDDSAGEAYREATKSSPWAAEGWAGLGWFLHSRRRNPAEAEHAYRTALSIEPADTTSWDNLGLLLKQEGRREEAEQAYCRALAADPTYDEALKGLSSLMGDRRSHEEAVIQLRRAIAASPNSTMPREILFAVASTKLIQDDWDGAAHAVESALSSNADGTIDPKLAGSFRSSFLREAVRRGLSAKCVELLDRLGLGEAWVPIREAVLAIGDRQRLKQLVPEVRVAAETVWDEIQPLLDVDFAAAEGDSTRVLKLIEAGANEPMLWSRPKVSTAAWFLDFSALDEASVEELRPELEKLEPILVSHAGFRRFRRAKLAFFPHHSLIAIEDLKVRGQNEQFAIRSPDGSLRLLDWTNEPIYSTGDICSPQFDDENVLLYCRFMFHFVRGKLGRFLFVEEIGQIPWEKEATEELRRKVADKLHPLSVIENAADHVRLRGSVIFKNALFITDCILAKTDGYDAGDSDILREGQWKLTDEELLFEDLPVIVDGSPGVFG